MKYHALLFTLVIAILSAACLSWWLRKRRLVFDVPEGSAALLYRHGLYVRRNNAGRHLIWGRGWTVKTIDLRKTSLLVPGQEVLTADNISLRISLLATYQVVVPDKAMHEAQDWLAELHHSVQLALRAAVNALTLEELLNQRPDLGAQLLARLQPGAARIGVQWHTIGVKHIALPSELKRAFSDVLKTKHEGHAVLAGNG